MSAAPFTLDWALQSAIGTFLFSAYIKEQCNDYCRINFCEDVLRFKKLRGKPRLDKGKEIVDVYIRGQLRPAADENGGDQRGGNGADDDGYGSSGDDFGYDREGIDFDKEMRKIQKEMVKNLKLRAGGDDDVDQNEVVLRLTKLESRRKKLIAARIRKASRKWKMPAKTEIEEYDLERRVPDISISAPEQLLSLYKFNMDYPTCSECCVGIKGSMRRELFLKVEEVSNNEKMRKAESSRQMVEAAKNSGELGSSDDEGLGAESGDDDEMNNGKVSSIGGSSHSSGGRRKKGDGKVPVRLSANRQDAKTLKPASMHVLHTDNMRTLTQSLRLTSARYLPQDVFDKAEAVVMESLKRDYWEAFSLSEYYLKLKNFLWYQERRVIPEDFFVMRVLGRGGFGLVTACKKGTSGKLYAMKTMSKRRIKMKKAEQLARNEQKALAAVESKFVVNLKYSFHTRDEVFLILDLMTGGDLGYHLHLRKQGFFPKKECQYYAARIMLGLQALHDKKYVYRDLKPENCLLADDGRVKITDLGLATKITPNLHGAAGTRGYWAPEMLRRDRKGRRMPYGHTVDWFSFGCCLAEFISGTNPFRSEAALNFGLERGKQTKEKAIDCATLEMEPILPEGHFEPDAADLCRRLLDKNEKNRLGYSGCEEIMAHPWFKNVDWEAIISDKKRPPFSPPNDVNAASQSEIGNFVEDKAYLETVLTEADEEAYANWDFTNPRAFAAEVLEFLIYERETGEPLLPISHEATCCCVVL